MSKFCHECGAQLFEENAKFCSICGAKTVKDKESTQILPESRKHGNLEQYEPEEEEEEETNPHSQFMGIVSIIMGIGAILFIYIKPVVSVAGLSLTIADIHSYCSTNLVQLVSGNACSQYSGLFYILWILAIIFIVLGIIELVLGSR